MKKTTFFITIFSIFLIGFFSRLSASMIDLAFEAHQKGDLVKAEQYYHKALEEGGNKAIIHYNLGNLYYVQEKLGDTVLSYRRAIEASPSFKEAYLNLGRIYYFYGDYIRALEVFLSYKKQSADDYKNGLLLADTYKKLRMYPQALREYQLVVRTYPYREEGYIALADFYLVFDDKEAAYQEAVDGYDNVGFSKSLVLYEADILREVGRYDEAVSVYRSLLQGHQVTNFSPNERYDIELKIVYSLLSASNVNYALFELEKLVETHPDRKVGIDYLESIYLVYEKVGRGFYFLRDFYPKNPELSYRVIKNFLADAYNRDDFFLVREMITFLDSKGIEDDLAKAIKNELSFNSNQ